MAFRLRDMVCDLAHRHRMMLSDVIKDIHFGATDTGLRTIHFQTLLTKLVVRMPETTDVVNRNSQR